MSKVLVIGDVMDDIIVVTYSPMRVNTDTEAEISQTLGGSAGNIASWAAFNNADVTFLGCVNSNDAQRVSEDFKRYGVKVNLQHNQNQTGKLISIVEGSNRSMLSNRGANKYLDFDSISENFLANFQFVFISGYAFFGKTISEIQTFIESLKLLHLTVLLDPGSAGFIEDFGKQEFIKAIHAVDIVLPNQEEFELIGKDFPVVIVTKGDQGVDFYEKGNLIESFVVDKVVVQDPTGAGDSFAGAFVAGIAKGEDYRSAIKSGMRSAAKAVTTIGARPEL